MKLPRKQRPPPTWEGPSLYLNCAMQLRVNRGSRQWLALTVSCTPIMAVTLKTFIPSFTTDCLAISTRYTKAEKEVKNTFSSFLFEAPPLPSTPFLLDLPCFSLVPPSFPPGPLLLGLFSLPLILHRRPLHLERELTSPQTSGYVWTGVPVVTCGQPAPFLIPPAVLQYVRLSDTPLLCEYRVTLSDTPLSYEHHVAIN